MEKERGETGGVGVSGRAGGYTAGVINAQCNQPRQMLRCCRPPAALNPRLSAASPAPVPRASVRSDLIQSAADQSECSGQDKSSANTQ